MNNPEREILTIKEFAEREGITVQAVYSRIKGSLKPFSLIFNGIKCIDYSAYLRHKQPEREIPTIKEGLKDIQPPIKPPLNPEQDALIDTLQEQVKTLTTALDAERAARLDDERRHNQQIIEITQMHQQQIQELTKSLQAAQALEADTRMEIKELRAPKPEPEQETGQPEQRRHNWLYRLFVRKG